MISALNESSEEPDSDEESEVELTREAQVIMRITSISTVQFL